MPAGRTVTIEAKVAWLTTQTSVSPPRWMGVCEELNLATEGSSLDELHSLIPETIHLLMVDLVKDHEFDAYLREKGWSATGDLPDENPNETQFNLPWQMITEGGSGLERSPH